MSFLKDQLKYDSMMPEDDPVAHSYTGEVAVNGVIFTFIDGEIITVNEGDYTISFYDWTGACSILDKADRIAMSRWIKEQEGTR
jgi:hypothetical protein